MRLITRLGNRLALASALAGAFAPGLGCRRAPYIDQGRPVPSDPAAAVAEEDAEVKAAAFLQNNSPLPMPRLTDPRTTSNPEAEEIWELTLQEAIKIGLDNSEVVRVIALGAQGIPVGGFEPTPLNTGAGGALGTGTLTTVYDPAIQETQIAQALSAFDASLSTTLFWGRNTAPFNNSIQAGVFNVGQRFPVLFDQNTANFSTTVQKRTATGATMSIAHNVQWQYSNSPTNVFPSAYTTNTQLRFSQPLLGSAPNGFNQNPGPAGLEANRAPIVIARLNADASVWRFKAEVMAHVRSVEQQYWALAQAQVQYWASETAVDLGERLLRQERARFEVGSASKQDVAEAAEQLERFKLDFVDRTANLITTERQLRNILGLPPTDNRRIVPVTAPTEARLEPDWQTCLRQMVSFQPDIVQNQLLVRVAELQLLVSRNQLLPVLNFDALYQFNGLGHNLDTAEAVMSGKSLRAIDPMLQFQQRTAGLQPQPGNYNDFRTWQVGFTYQMPIGYRGPLANVRQAQYALLRQRAFLQQVVHQTTHSLYRFFLEVDSNYKAFRTASRLKAAALTRLEAARAYYEVGGAQNKSGRVVGTIADVLEAVNRYANALALEADYRTRYNTAIIALEEAKGTLLAYDNIALAEGPWPAKAYVQARDQVAGHNQHPTGGNGSYQPPIVNGPGMTDPVPPQAPPNAGTNPPRALFPAPAGPLPPPPAFAPPTVPAGEPNNISSRPPQLREPAVVPASTEAPASASAPSDALPTLPPASREDLPPLPPGRP